MTNANVKYKRAKRSKPVKNYIDNQKFLEALLDYKAEVKAAEENNQERPRIPDYIGQCFLDLARNISYSNNWIGYSYKEDFISDGLENAVKYIDNFDPNISRNPFAYFTQMIIYAFMRRIKIEKKQTYIKFKTIDMADIEEDTEFGNLVKAHYGTLTNYKDEFIKKYEDALKNETKKTKKNKKNKLELLLDSE